MDKQLRETLETISNRLPLVTIEGYDKKQRLFQGHTIKKVFNLKVLPDGSKIRDKTKYMIDTPQSIRDTHLHNLKKLVNDNPEDWKPCQAYIDAVNAEAKLLEDTKHDVIIQNG